MAGGTELEIPYTFHLSSLSVIATLNYVGSPGQIFFCTLCSAPCYNDSQLYNHLIDKPHTERLAIAKITLLKSNPWPFSDGVNFFSNSPEQEYKPLPFPDTDLGLLMVGDDLMSTKIEPKELDSNGVGVDCDLVISKVLHKGKISDLKLSCMGFGKIGTRVLENDKGLSEIKRIWCEWLGKKASKNDEDIRNVEEHDFAVIVFAYCDTLGKNLLLHNKPRFSDYASGKKSESPKSSSSSTSNLDRIETRFLQSRLVEMFKQRRRLIAGEGLCCVCHLKMLPGTDVATLFNTNTRIFSCSSISFYRQFHVFHISCLVHWILICEFGIWTKKSSGAEVKQSSKRKRSTDDLVKKQIACVICPDCHGTGIKLGTDGLEKPTVPFSEVVQYKLEMTDGVKRWINSPEELQNCSTGLLFASKSDETFQEKVLPLKLLRFYSVNE